MPIFACIHVWDHPTCLLLPHGKPAADVLWHGCLFVWLQPTSPHPTGENHHWVAAILPGGVVAWFPLCMCCGFAHPGSYLTQHDVVSWMSIIKCRVIPKCSSTAQAVTREGAPEFSWRSQMEFYQVNFSFHLHYLGSETQVPKLTHASASKNTLWGEERRRLILSEWSLNF